MECNREEAIRAKEIAEKKFMAKDIGGAKKFALKAQKLFPSLDGINQMMATLDVYLSSGAISNGEKDWYAVLSVNPSADDETLKKQYRKLALQLHPDKNKSIGAEGAFQIISEAWSVLSDKNRRLLYDQKRHGKVFQAMTTPSQKDYSHSVPYTSNGLHNFPGNSATKVRAQKRNSGMPPPVSSSTSSGIPPPSSRSTNNGMPPPSSRSTNSGMPPPSSSSINNAMPPPPSNSISSSSQRSESKSFWTSCNGCKMQYEYLRVYMNTRLICPKCTQGFVAKEFPSSSSSHVSSRQKLQDINSATKNGNGASIFPRMGSIGMQHGEKLNSHNSSSFQWGPFSRTAGSASATASSTAAVGNLVQQAYEKVRREREEAQAAARKEEAFRKRSQGLNRNTCGSAGLDGNAHSFPKVDRHAKRKRGITDDAGTKYGGGKTECTGGDSVYSFKSEINSRKFNLRKGFPQGNVRNILMNKSKNKIHKITENWTSAAAAKCADKENGKKKQKVKENVIEKVKEVVCGNDTNQDKMNEQKSNVKQASAKKDLCDAQIAGSDNEVIEPVNIAVPDPDFHDFDKDRTERSFHGDEIWATYDDEDGMPRYYALIQKVVSVKPFKVRMSFLNSKSNSEFGPLDWVASGFAKTSGEFRVGRYEVKDELNVFSHKVKWEKGPRGVIKIVPRKGEIWALYRNWSPDWNEHTPDEVIYKYDMFEVLEDFNEDQGVSIAPLVKMAGFKTVFQRHANPQEVMRIPREEMFRFSHQVPSYVLTGEEGSNAPKGCYELDPAATPLELLEVVTETKDDQMTQASEHQEEQAVS